MARSRFAYVGALLAAAGVVLAAGRAGRARHAAADAGAAGESAWDWRAALERLQRFILAHLGDPEAILVLDEPRS